MPVAPPVTQQMMPLTLYSDSMLKEDDMFLRARDESEQ
jgi:hypothetical protein